MKSTHHSEYGKIKSVYLKRVNDSFIDQKNIASQWENLNFLSEPNFETAVNEYEYFENIIRSTGAEVLYFDLDKSLQVIN